MIGLVIASWYVGSDMFAVNEIIEMWMMALLKRLGLVDFVTQGNMFRPNRLKSQCAKIIVPGNAFVYVYTQG
jgi:hypothetical protein